MLSASVVQIRVVVYLSCWQQRLSRWRERKRDRERKRERQRERKREREREKGSDDSFDLGSGRKAD
jgi:hypothetical protein